jgi:hypothetical protein
MNEFIDVSLQAVGCIEKVSKHVNLHYPIDKSSYFVSEDLNDINQGKASSGGSWVNLRIWFLMLTGLSRITSDSRIEVRTRALTVLINILRLYGKEFNEQTWKLVYRGVLFPIFDDLQHNSIQNLIRMPGSKHSDVDIVAENSWARTTCLQALEILTELFCQFFTATRGILPEIMNLFQVCLNQPNLEVASSCLKCWIRLASTVKTFLTDEEMIYMIENFRKCIQFALPIDLLSSHTRIYFGLDEANNLEISPDDKIKLKCSFFPEKSFEIEPKSSFSGNLFHPISPDSSEKSNVAPFDSQSILSYSLIAIFLIEGMRDFCDLIKDVLSIDQFERIFDILGMYFTFVDTIKSDKSLKVKVESHFENRLNLCELETTCLRAYFEILMILQSIPELRAHTLQKVQKYLENLLREFLMTISEFEAIRLEGRAHQENEFDSEVRCKEPLVCTILAKLQEVDDLKPIIPSLSIFLVELVGVGSHAVRKELKHLLNGIVSPLAPTLSISSNS